jgi:hypothetical protein
VRLKAVYLPSFSKPVEKFAVDEEIASEIFVRIKWGMSTHRSMIALFLGYIMGGVTAIRQLKSSTH